MLRVRRHLVEALARLLPPVEALQVRTMADRDAQLVGWLRAMRDGEPGR